MTQAWDSALPQKMQEGAVKVRGSNLDFLPQSKNVDKGKDEMLEVQLALRHQKEDNTKVNKHKLIKKAFINRPTDEFYL